MNGLVTAHCSSESQNRSAIATSRPQNDCRESQNDNPSNGLFRFTPEIEVQTAQGKSIAVASKEATVSEHEYEGRVAETGDLQLAKGGADRTRSLANDLQPRPIALVLNPDRPRPSSTRI